MVLYNGFLGLCRLAEGHSPSLCLALDVHGVDFLHLGPREHLLNRFPYLALVRLRVYQKCVLLISHRVHALLGHYRFQNNIIVLNVSHYAYTSSIFATAALVTTTVLYFKISYTLMVLTLAVLTAGMFLADSAALLLASSKTTSALLTFKLSRTFLKFLVLISSKLKSSTTMNLLSFTLLVRADLRAALFSFLLSLMV